MTEQVTEQVPARDLYVNDIVHIEIEDEDNLTLLETEITRIRRNKKYGTTRIEHIATIIDNPNEDTFVFASDALVDRVLV